jgi:antitoxin MazE
MLSKVQPWGNSQGIRINKQLLEIAHLQPGEPVEITAFEGKIIIEPVSKVRGKYELEALIKKMPKNVEEKEEPWGSPQGKEVW